MRGGKREGGGRRKGVSYLEPGEKRVQLAISMPEAIKNKLKENHHNLSKYILKLIHADYEKRGLSLD